MTSQRKTSIKSKDPVAALAALAERIDFHGKLDFQMVKEQMYEERWKKKGISL